MNENNSNPPNNNGPQSPSEPAYLTGPGGSATGAGLVMEFADGVQTLPDWFVVANGGAANLKEKLTPDMAKHITYSEVLQAFFQAQAEARLSILVQKTFGNFYRNAGTLR